jgi:hypothetical protein
MISFEEKQGKRSVAFGRSLTPEGELLFRRIGSFRPSDRFALQRALESESDRRVAIAAVEAFVQQWDRSDWIEEYSIERIGKWLASSAPASAVDEIAKWASGGWGNRRGRAALIKGIALGRSGAAV